MDRGARKDLNDRKVAHRLLSKLYWSTFRGCKTVADMKAVDPDRCHWLVEAHNCSCGRCRMHSRRYAGNSHRRYSVAHVRQSQALESGLDELAA